MAILDRLFKIVGVDIKISRKEPQLEAQKQEKKEEIDQIIAGLEDKEIFNDLDYRQKQAVLSENPRTLVLAGAGAGKTRVLLHRILHLIKNKKVNSGKILAMTFTRDATNEMLDRLITHFEPKYGELVKKKHKDLADTRKYQKKKHPETRYITIRTIHSLCYKILKEDGAKVFNTNFRVIGNDDKKTESPQEKIIKLIIYKISEKNPDFLNDVKEYILDYMIEYDKIDNTKKIQSGRYVTLKGDRVKSKSERLIANFLYQHKIRYEYEKQVTWADMDDPSKTFKPDFYLPDYDIYIEHWFITNENDKVDSFLKDEFKKKKYLEGKNWKLKQFKRHNRILIESNEQQMRGNINEYYDYLYSQLKKNANIKLIPSKEVIENISHLKEGLALLIKGIGKILNLAKSNRVSTNDIKQRVKDEKHDEVLRFYDIFIHTYNAYEKYLVKESLIDFNDMVHNVIKLFKENPEILSKYQNMYQHILVDEYQDVSAAQVELIKLLLTKENFLFTVGDDWQSIYGFRGSEVEFIVQFDTEFKNSNLIILPFNYRSGNNIVEASNVVIKKNPNQIDKNISAFDKEKDEKIFQFDSLNEIDAANFIIERKISLKSRGYKSEDIMLLYRRTSHIMPYRSVFKKRGFSIETKTIHGSKGLEAKVIFLVGLRERGFPYVWEDERIVQVIKKTNLNIKKEEERRIFYVAMTRAKERLFLMSEKYNESEYCKDVPDEFKKVKISKSEFTEDMLSKFLEGIYSMVKEGKSVEEIAKAINKEERDVEIYIAKLIESGLLDVQKFVDKKSYDLIKKKISKVEEGMTLYPIKRNLPKNITYGQIRYVIADLKGKSE